MWRLEGIGALLKCPARYVPDLGILELLGAHTIHGDLWVNRERRLGLFGRPLGAAA